MKGFIGAERPHLLSVLGPNSSMIAHLDPPSGGSSALAPGLWDVEKDVGSSDAS